MKEIKVTISQWAQLYHLQRTRKWSWPAVFSTNSSGSIWAGTTYSRTPLEEREELSDLVPLLNQIRDLYLGMREPGGRMFVNLDGAFYKDEQKQEFQIVKFNLDYELGDVGKK